MPQSEGVRWISVGYQVADKADDYLSGKKKSGRKRGENECESNTGMKEIF